jgi:hypothetical protein
VPSVIALAAMAKNNPDFKSRMYKSPLAPNNSALIGRVNVYIVKSSVARGCKVDAT